MSDEEANVETVHQEEQKVDETQQQGEDAPQNDEEAQNSDIDDNYTDQKENYQEAMGTSNRQKFTKGEPVVTRCRKKKHIVNHEKAWNMTNIDHLPKLKYNALKDDHLNSYFVNGRVRKHLKKMDLITPDGYIVEKPDVYRRNKNLLRQHGTGMSQSRSPKKSTSRNKTGGFGNSTTGSPKGPKSKIREFFPNKCLKEMLTFKSPPPYVLYTLECLNYILQNCYDGDIILKKSTEWVYLQALLSNTDITLFAIDLMESDYEQDGKTFDMLTVLFDKKGKLDFEKARNCSLCCAIISEWIQKVYDAAYIKTYGPQDDQNQEEGNQQEEKDQPPQEEQDEPPKEEQDEPPQEKEPSEEE